VNPKLAIGIKSRERLRRLADVFAVELRLRIVTALYNRPMSAKQFFNEFGGGSSTRVNQNFERLAKTGWLRLVHTEGPGGARRGGVECFYRSTELAFFDAESWALVPYSMRVASSWSLFKQIAKRLRQALEVTSQRGRKRDLSCVDLLLDQVGWEHVIDAVNAQFVCIFEEQEDAQLRASDSGEELISVDVLLIAFESPIGHGQIDPSLVEIDKEPLIPFPERLAPVLADDVCMQIVSELNRREMSVTQFHREFGGAFGGIRSRFKRLERVGWLKKVNEQTGGSRRGTSEHFYLATRPAMVSDDAWQNPPDSLKAKRSWATFHRFCETVLKAMREGTFDARVDRSVTLSFLNLDQRGWANVIAGIESLEAFILEEQESAKARMKKSGEKPLAATVGLAAFETPGELAKEP
jgi:hypothetical protein